MQCQDEVRPGSQKDAPSGLVTQNSGRLRKQKHWGHQREMFLLAQGTGMLPSPETQLAAWIRECQPGPWGRGGLDTLKVPTSDG